MEQQNQTEAVPSMNMPKGDNEALKLDQNEMKATMGENEALPKDVMEESGEGDDGQEKILEKGAESTTD